MKKIFLMTLAGMLLLTGCKDKEVYNENYQIPDLVTNEVTQAEIDANVKKIFGVTFSPDQDWCTTTSGKITIRVSNSDLRDVKKVMILTGSPFGNSDANGVLSLNESEMSYGQEVTLYYDAPKMYDRLYAACVNTKGEFFIKGFNVGDEMVEFKSNTVVTRSSAGDFNLDSLVATLPANPTLFNVEPSFANQRNWSGWSQDFLYTLAPAVEAAQCLTIPDYTEDYKSDLYHMIFEEYLRNKVDNVNKIKNSIYYMSNNNYPFTTGDEEHASEPIILAPIYKNDSIYREIENCDIYYYYFHPDSVLNKTDAEQVAFLKKLPKYKAVELYNSIVDPHEMINNQIKRETAYALIYWGDGTPDLNNTTGSYSFPRGYKIGFMLRSIDSPEKRAKDGPIRDGEVYCDGRLNTDINNYGHFRTSHLGPTDPRMAWFWANNRKYLCCESGSDKDFNDVVFEVLGGIMVPPPPTIDQNKYTFCYEDTKLGDYDLNDVVIRAYRKDKTHVVYQLVACGAFDELYIRNINGVRINQNTEVHTMFGKPGPGFINTTNAHPETAFVIDTLVVAENFSFLNPETQPYIYDKSNKQETKLAVAGQDPHAIMVPYEFRYPLEKICVKYAYSMFNSWGEGAVLTDDRNGFKWYLTFDEKKVTEAIPSLNVTYDPNAE